MTRLIWCKILDHPHTHVREPISGLFEVGNPTKPQNLCGSGFTLSDINGERFRLYVEKVLVPSLRPGDIVILDNLGSHKGSAVRRAIRSAGARLFFLPKYSPDLNPIEQLFAKLKHLLRKAGERTVDAVCNAIGQIPATITPQECRNYLAQAG